MDNASKYGICSRCGSPLIPVWFTEEEEVVNNGVMYKTGRKRRACSHLTCPMCLCNEIVDDTYDGKWY